MKKILIALNFIIVATAFVSCKKDNSSPATVDIAGTWNFVSMDVTTSSSQEFNDGTGNQKTETSSNYTTEDNSGTVTFDASNMSTNNISYSVNTTAKSKYYLNGSLISSFDVPFNFTAPASTGSTSYRVISADSIYFDQGSVFMNGVAQSTTPSGAKLSLNGNMLSMTSSIAQTTNQVISGINFKMDVNATAIIRLQKQ